MGKAEKNRRQRAAKKVRRAAARSDSAPAASSGPILRPQPKVRPGRLALSSRPRPSKRLVIGAPPAEAPAAAPWAAPASRGREGPDWRLRFFPESEEGCCRVCGHPFSGDTREAPGLKWKDLCSNCVPVLGLIERLRDSTPEVRQFCKEAVASLNTHIGCHSSYPLPAGAHLAVRFQGRSAPRRANPYD